MPYTKKGDRIFVDDMLSDMLLFNSKGEIAAKSLTEGDMNYLITSALKNWLDAHDKNYAHYNAAIGILECAKQELYRRVISPYEDKKIKENGDVYGS